MGKKKGAMTVEAAIVLPLYILLLTFLVNFLNIYYLHTVVQHGLNSAASTLAQYCYAVDLTLGVENISLQEETSAKAQQLGDAINNFYDASTDALTLFNDGISLDNLGKLLDSGKTFINASSNLVSKVQGVTGEDVANLVLTGMVETGGGMLVEAMVDDYLDQMKINRDLLGGDIQYGLYITSDGRYDLILTAAYQYNDPLFALFTPGFAIRQQAVVHPWIGGATPGLRGGG